MKEAYVNFTTAKLAKEKGFNIPTYSDCWVETLDGLIIHNSERDHNDPLHERAKYYLSEPSLELLKKWLREIHNIHVSAFPVFKHIWFCSVSIITNEGLKQVTGAPYDASNSNNTYEEALEQGLIEALNLI